MSSGRSLREVRITHTGIAARSLYSSLMEEPESRATREKSALFLEQQLQHAQSQPNAIPLDPGRLESAMEQQTFAAGEAYAEYLKARKAGAPRRYFTCKSHAFSFLQGVAPTKLVDGAWLYGLLSAGQDLRYHHLIRTYLEELGDGSPAQNHVVLYKRLLHENDCDLSPRLSDEHYTQGAIQLALAYNASNYLPEIIGYNLGYEQLPLHLLITAFELNELDIDPYYFTLHVTIDNASTGHARKAVQAVLENLPASIAERREFMQRVANGFGLNGLGLSSTDVIKGFDLDRSLIEMLQRKSVFGRAVHSDYCSFGGRTVNEWLSEPKEIETFLRLLERKGWIARHTDPRESRFWRMIDDEGAAMFGVFSGAERQLIYDWIAGDWLNPPEPVAENKRKINRKPFRRRRQKAYRRTNEDSAQEIPADNGVLGQQSMSTDELIKLMAPGLHDTPEGLAATRIFSARFP